jgi:hypothetical protein
LIEFMGHGFTGLARIDFTTRSLCSLETQRTQSEKFFVFLLRGQKNKSTHPFGRRTIKNEKRSSPLLTLVEIARSMVHGARGKGNSWTEKLVSGAGCQRAEKISALSCCGACGACIRHKGPPFICLYL